MAFDPDAYQKTKNSLAPAPASGFDPSAYERAKQAMAAPPSAPARPGPVGRALDFARRAFMSDTVEPSSRGVVSNAVSDAKDIITGTSHLMGQGLVEGAKLAGDVGKSIGPMVIKSVLGHTPSPQEVANFTQSPLAERAKALPGQVAEITSPEGVNIAKNDFIRPAIDSFKSSFTRPIKSFSEHPLFTMIDWTTALDAVGGAARAGLNIAEKGAKLAGAAETAAKISDLTSTTRPALEVAPHGQVLREYSKNPIIKNVFQKKIDQIASNPQLQEFISQSPVLKWIAPDSFINPEALAGRVAGKVANKAQSEFYAARNARMNEAMTQFNKLPENERQSFVAIVQGRAVPRVMSPQFKGVYDWYKNTVADEQAKFHLADETVKRVAYQPLAVAQGLLSPDDYRLALRGDAPAIERVRKITNDLIESRTRVQEQAIKDWMGSNTNIDRRTKEFKATASEIAKQTAPDPIYFPSVFADKLKVSDFLPNKFLQRFKPGFLKGRTGAFGFIEKAPEDAFAIHQSQVERYMHNEALISAIKDKFALPLKKATDLKPGYKVFAPDGYIGFYRGSMPLQEAFLRGVGMGQHIDDSFTNAIHKVLPEIMPQDKSFVGVRKPTLYQVPADVASKVQDAISPQVKVPEAFKLFYDKPLQAFKFSVLAMSPRWVVNNTLGNIVTTMSGRVSPESFIKANKQVYKDLIPPEVGSGGFRRSEFPGIDKIITPHTGIADKVTGFFSGKTPTEGPLKSLQNVISVPFKAGGKVASTVFEANAKIEDLFRNATFIDKTTKAAVEKIGKDVSTGVFGMKAQLDKFLQRGSFADSNVAKVAGEMLKNDDFKMHMVSEVNRILNDYNSLTKFERGVVRRVIPFWSWWKFMNIMFWTMPVKDPMMAQTIKQLGMAGQEISANEWKANGLNVKDIPEWMRGNVILSKTPDGKLLDMLNTKSMNPLSTAADPTGLSPQLQMYEERRTGRNYLTGANFTHPNETELHGTLYRRENGKTERIDHATPPPLLSHIARQIPQVGIAESLAFPYKTYTGEGIFNNAIRTSRGKEVALNPALKIAGILGMPVSEVDYRRLRIAKRESNQASSIIRKQMQRSGRALERVKLKGE